MLKKSLAMLIALLMLLLAIPAATFAASGGDALEEYTFTHYFDYDWWDVAKLQWGVDEASKYFKEKFNINVIFTKPDADANARRATMIQSGDLPDSIMMDRGVNNKGMAQLGLFVPLEQFFDRHTWFQDNVLESTREMLKVEGELYGIPNWSRKAASGGNEAWMYSRRIWEDLGSPEFNTLEDIHAFLLAAKELGVNREGLEIIPVAFGRSPEGQFPAAHLIRSFGGYIDWWYTVIDGQFRLAFRDDTFKEVSMTLNQWYREGLILDTYFTDSEEQTQEKRVSGRVAGLLYDFSQDDTNQFMTILENTFPGDSYDFMNEDCIYPPVSGLSYDDVMYNINSTVGWNVTCITTSAEKPERIYDLWTFFLTQEAARIQQFGPPGQGLYDDIDDYGNPILLHSIAQIDEEEYNRLGLWFWMIPGQSDNVDIMKFSVNEAAPPEEQAYIAHMQYKVFTPKMPLSDELVGVRDVLDPTSDEQYNRRLCEDYIAERYPMLIMAPTAEEAEAIYAEILAFCDDNGMPEIEELFDAKYQENVATQGFSIFK